MIRLYLLFRTLEHYELFMELGLAQLYSFLTAIGSGENKCSSGTYQDLSGLEIFYTYVQGRIQKRKDGTARAVVHMCYILYKSLISTQHICTKQYTVDSPGKSEQ